MAKKALTFGEYIENRLTAANSYVTDVTGFFRNGRKFGGSHRQTAKKHGFNVTAVRTPRGKQVVLAAPVGYAMTLNAKAIRVATGG